MKADWSGKCALYMSLLAWVFVWMVHIDLISLLVAALYFVMLPYIYAFSRFGVYIILFIAVARLGLVLYRNEDISEVFSRNAGPIAIGIILSLIFMFVINYENYVP